MLGDRSHFNAFIINNDEGGFNATDRDRIGFQANTLRLEVVKS